MFEILSDRPKYVQHSRRMIININYDDDGYDHDHDDGNGNDDDDDDDDKHHYSCNSVNFQMRTFKFCMEVYLHNI